MGGRLLPLALLVAVGHVDAWTSQYHDPQNTGMTQNQAGPQDMGLCTVGELDGFEIGYVLFQSTGVLSSDGTDLYFGGCVPPRRADPPCRGTRPFVLLLSQPACGLPRALPPLATPAPRRPA